MTATITLNGEPRTLPQSPLILAELLVQLDATTPGYAVALNGKVVPRQHWEQQTVSGGDALLLIQPIAGG